MPSTSLLSRPASAASRTLLTTTSLLLAFASFSHALNAMTYEGCYSSSAPLTDQGSYQYQTSGYCQPICANKNQAVLGLSGGSDCWCGSQLPAASSKVDDSFCNTPCNGFGSDMCGGTNYYSVYLSGTEANVPNFSGGDSSSSTSQAGSPSPTSPTTSASPAPTSKTTAPASVITSIAPGTTIVVTRPASEETASATSAPTAQPKHSGGGSNVAGIAAGVVVGVVVAAALIGGAFLFWRHKKRQQAQEDFRRATQVKDFMQIGSEGKPPATGHSNMSDSRLDPEAGNRRNSSGSIADNQDYSRRILRVANPDDS